MRVKIAYLHIAHLAVLEILESGFMSEFVAELFHHSGKEGIKRKERRDYEWEARKLIVIADSLSNRVFLKKTHPPVVGGPAYGLKMAGHPVDAS